MGPLSRVVSWCLWLSMLGAAWGSLSQRGVGVPAPYKESLAKEMALWAGAAYCTPHNPNNLVPEFVCNQCQMIPDYGAVEVTRIFLNGSDDIHGFAAVHHSLKRIILSFKGTDSQKIIDWIDDLDGIMTTPYPTQYPDIRMHRGFYWSFMSIEPQVTAALHELQAHYPSYPLYIVGHSLGGALAVNAVFYYAVNQQFSTGLPTVYTIGEPRIGNKAFADTYGSFGFTNYRLVHFRDMVPHLPPTQIGFWHGMTEVYYNQNFSSYQICTHNDGEDPQCSDRQFDLSIPDHLDYFNIDPSNCQ